MIRLLFFSFLAVSALSAQVSGGGSAVTVTATPSQTIQPDQVGFNVTISSPVGTSLDAVLGALQGTGLTAANFFGLGSMPQYTNTGKAAGLALNWQFLVLVPAAGVKTEIAALQALASSLQQGSSGLSLSFSAQGPQVSSQALAQACGLADLVAAARSKAQQVAAGANRKPGAISSLSYSVSTMIGPSATMPYVVPSCSLTATFGNPPQSANTLTISATRTVNVPPDQATISATVLAPAGGSLDDALAALGGSGFTAANLQYFYANSQSSPQAVQWDFSLTLPLAKISNTLTALQQAAAQNSGVSFGISGTQASSALIAAQDCSYGSLLNDAQAEARLVTAAAGVSLNDLIAVSDGTLGTQVVVAGDFSALLSASRLGVGAILGPYFSATPTSCGLVAQYGIGQ